MIENINRYIDHTLLKPAAQERDIEKLCQEARAFSFASVCINPGYVSLAKRLLSGSDVSVCTVIGFPLGATTTACKAAETREAYENGCDEFDMVISVGALNPGCGLRGEGENYKGHHRDRIAHGTGENIGR